MSGVDGMRRDDREIKGRDGIEEIIRLCKTCHVAMVDKGSPYAVPMNFGYRFLEDDSLELYFHCAYEGKKIDILKRNNKVCFEMAFEGESVFPDVPCNSGYYFASIIGFGEVVFVEEAAEKCDALSTMFKHQTGRDVAFTPEQADTVCVFKIVSADFTGKRKSRPKA